MTGPGRSRRRARGALSVVAALLVASALLRVTIGATDALARADTGETETAPLPVDAHCPAPADIAPTIAALTDREQRLAQREAQVTDRLHALRLAEEEIAAKTAELVAAEEGLRATLALVDTAAEDDISRLVRVYQAMKPKDAAQLFETMAPEFAAGFLARMTPEAAAGILAGLTPQAAYTISVVLAGRNASVPRE